MTICTDLSRRKWLDRGRLRRGISKRRIWCPSFESVQVRAVSCPDIFVIPSELTVVIGETTSKYYIVDGVEALQKFGQDAW